jgi:hypothetical protein
MAAENNVLCGIAEIVGIPAQTFAVLRTKAEVMLLVLQSYVCVAIDDTIPDIADGNVGDIQDRMAL